MPANEPAAQKLGAIRNPLTVVGVFAGLAEVSGTIVLPLLKPEVQAIYVWFLMSFPVALVLLFFVTLWLKHHVLYAPSDFRSDESFTGMLVAGSSSTRVVRLLEEADAAATLDEPSSPSAQSNNLPSVERSASRREVRAAAFLAEELAIARLSRLEALPLQRNVAFTSNPSVVFDAIGNRGRQTVVVEVKYVRSGGLPKSVIELAYARFLAAYHSLDEKTRAQFRVVFAVVADAGFDVAASAARVHEVAATFPFKTAVHAFDIDSLESAVRGEFTADSVENARDDIEKRVLGLLAVRSLGHEDLLRALRDDQGNAPSKSDLQVVLGEMVRKRAIELDPISSGSFRLVRS